MINSTVRPIHFEDFSGSDFERLVFAYHLRAGWVDVEWYGQTGSDLGRDILGTEIFDDRQNSKTIIQCVNRGSLTQAKAARDMKAAVSAQTGIPDAFKFVCRSTVSAAMRDKIKAAAKKLGIPQVDIWSGAEFEEQLRLRAEFLLRRLVDGIAFPDEAIELRKFVDDFPDLPDVEILRLMAAVFDRPAFRTPFSYESYLPAFQQAIEDTIRAFNTGVWQTREGVNIRHIPSLHHLKSATNKDGVAKVVRELDEVRRIFKRRLADGGIEHCGCGDKNCPTFKVEPSAGHELDRARSQALLSFRALYPSFDVHLA